MMTTTSAEMARIIHTAWAPLNPAFAEDLQKLEWSQGKQAVKVFMGVKPVDVDISSAGFLGCDMLLEIPHRAAAIYLGTYLLSLIDGLRLQEGTGLFADVITHSHILYCLGEARFWQDVIRPHLSPECHEALRQLADYLAERRELLAYSEEEAKTITKRVADHLPSK